MAYVIKGQIGNRTLIGSRKFKTLASARKLIRSPAAKAYNQKYNVKNVRPIKLKKGLL